jgi:hypothetical protein
MKRILASPMILIFAASVCANQIDQTPYTETITVMQESKETFTKDLSTTYTHKPKTNILGQPETDLAGRPTGASKTTAITRVEHSTYCQAHGTIKDVAYVLNGRANAPCIPFGTFKAKITNGQYIDILVTEPNGNIYSVGFEIVQAEKITPAAPQAQPTAPAAPPPPTDRGPA